jgi:hypothetical protein
VDAGDLWKRWLYLDLMELREEAKRKAFDNPRYREVVVGSTGAGCMSGAIEVRKPLPSTPPGVSPPGN